MNGCKTKQKKIAFFGHFDSTNFGNESTLQAIIYNLRYYQSDAEVTCISTGPDATIATHQIEAIPIADKFVKSWSPQNPLLSVVRRIFIGIPSELTRWFKGLMRLRRVDMLIIPGTGLLTDTSGFVGWGPYSVFKWSLTAKLCRCKLLFVSVGAGPIYSTLGKYLVKSALSLANFRSYRDNSTMKYLKDIGFRTDDDMVYPDLAFSLPEAVIPHKDAKEYQRTVVGLGLMDYAGKYSNATRSNYISYLNNLVRMAGWLLARGDDVRLLIGDLGDARPIQEFRGLIRELSSGDDEGHIINEPILSVKDLLSQIATTDFVVATRFHNVVLALLCEKPVISISFHHKCESLMTSMGLSAYCLDTNSLNADILIEKICDIEANAARIKRLIRERVREFRRLLDEQYRFIFNNMGTGASAMLGQ
jgi:polysaccharide pyruvyl transferase WcaK-like protein